MYPENHPTFWAIDELEHVVDLNSKDKSWLKHMQERLQRQQASLEEQVNTAEESVNVLLQAVDTAVVEEAERLMNVAAFETARCVIPVDVKAAGRLVPAGLQRPGARAGSFCSFDREVNDARRASDISKQFINWIGKLQRTPGEKAMYEKLNKISQQRENILEQCDQALVVLKGRVETVVTKLALAREKYLQRFSGVDDGYPILIEMLAAEIDERVTNIQKRWIDSYSAIYGEFEGERYYASKSVFYARDCMFTRNLEEARLRTGGAVLAVLRLTTENMAHLDLGYYVIYHDLWASNQRALQVLERVKVLLTTVQLLAKTESEKSILANAQARVSTVSSECDRLAQQVLPYENRMAALFENLGHLRDDLMVREGLIKRTGERPPAGGGGGKFRVIRA